MKIKIFRCCNPSLLEGKINKFIKDKCVIKVLQSTNCCNRTICITITILYEDDYYCDYVKSKFRRVE